MRLCSAYYGVGLNKLQPLKNMMVGQSEKQSSDPRAVLWSDLVKRVLN